jgi:hypothetical protein
MRPVGVVPKVKRQKPTHLRYMNAQCVAFLAGRNSRLSFARVSYFYSLFVAFSAHNFKRKTFKCHKRPDSSSGDLEMAMSNFALMKHLHEHTKKHKCGKNVTLRPFLLEITFQNFK